MSPTRVTVRLVPGCSDGDPLHVPPPGVHTQVNPPTLYLEKIGQQWMESRKEARPGVQYTLESLPFGYSLWHRPRPSNPNHFDRYLYGHPGKKAFDSPNRFYPHFEHLMNNDGNSMGCPCTLCSGSSGVLPRATPSSSHMRSSSVASFRKSSNSSAPRRSRPSSSMSNHRSQQLPIVSSSRPSLTGAQHKGRPKKINPGIDTTNVDSEGTPDVYRNLVDKLRRHGHVDEAILEPLSPDWRAEQERIPILLEDLRTQEQWVPRNGDIVLYIRDLPDGVDLIRDKTNGLRLYDAQKNKFSTPQWEAGLVTEPASGTSVADLVDSAQDKNVSCTGVRVEPVPNPNDQVKSLSKRHKYIPLRQTRPMYTWRDLLRRVPQEDWHITIKNALALMSTLSLMGKHHFRGTWPNASIYCRGIYIGAEMLCVGDTVRLLPNNRSGQYECADVMSIKSIQLKWTNLDKASDNDYDEGRPYNSEIWIYGSAYTSEGSRSNKLWISEENVESPRVASHYADWYPLHPVNKELAVPYSRVLGRLYERDAVAYFLRSDLGELPNLDVGRQAVVEARAFSRKHDKRIAEEPNATWYWGDNRADALNLRTINGLEVSRFDPERDVKDLRRKIRVLDGMTPALPLRTSKVDESSRNRTHIVSFEGHGDDDDEEEGEEEEEEEEEEDGIDDEVRQHTRVVQEDRGHPKKRARVMVVID